MIPTQFIFWQYKQNITKKFRWCSSLVVTCCVTCYFESDPPYAGKRFLALNHVLYFFLVPSLPFDPLVLCNLITEIFFRSADHYNNGGTEISLQKLSAISYSYFLL